MRQKKNKEVSFRTMVQTRIHPRHINKRDRLVFERKFRKLSCLFDRVQDLLTVKKLDSEEIRNSLAYSCRTIESQILVLRDLTRLTKKDYCKRYSFTKNLLDCLLAHHDIIYEGILFGSSVNGLGFKDSDVDLRLRPLKVVNDGCLEPISYDHDMVERTLRNVAFQTTRCCPAIGEFVPSSRCPLAKLTFLAGNPNDLNTLQEGINYDISLSSSNSLGSFNSVYLRFLCLIEPKFHLLATILRYWSKVHKLIVPGYLSSYALINMLIFFCQTNDPPLLPTVNQMRDLYFKEESLRRGDVQRDNLRGITQIEWHCMICLNKDMYTPSSNKEPLCVLLLKFFEFYLNFPYSSHIITTRPGDALGHEEFRASTQFHPGFPIKDYVNIQDPFDLKHNLTSGMTGEHFQRIIVTIRYSYERLFKELLCNFKKPTELRKPKKAVNSQNSKVSQAKSNPDPRDWGLNILFVELTEKELKEAE